MIQYKQTQKGLEVKRVLFNVNYYGYLTDKDLKIIIKLKKV